MGRSLIRILIAALLPWIAHAQGYPNKPIRFIVPYSAGTTTDLLARHYAQKMSELLGQPFVIENKVGAGGNIAAEFVARAPGDGYTLSFATSAVHATNPTLYGKVPFDPIKDFTHVTLLVAAPNLLAINPKIPVTNMAELIAYARANPGKLTYISAGSGTSPHMAGELLKNMASIDIRHVAYKNFSQGLTDLFSGEVAMTFYHVPLIYPHVKAGKVRALAVATRERSPIAPEVPPIADTVAGYDLRPWWGLCAPAGLSPQIVQTLHGASMKVLGDPDTKQKFVELGLILTPLAPKEFNEFVATEITKWSKIVRDSGARVD